MSYLITGGGGFLGSYVTREILKKGEEVVIYDLKVRGTTLDSVLTEKEIAKLKLVQGDITDLPFLLNVLKQNNVKKVIHLSGVLAPVTETNPYLATKVNCEGAQNVFEAARILGLSKVVWASSNGVFGQLGLGGGSVRGEANLSVKLTQSKIQNEDSPTHPTTVYGATKVLCEFMGNYYTEKFGLDIIGLRMVRTIGLGKVTGGGREFAELVWNVAKNRPVVIPNADFIKPYLYVEDLARAFVLAVEAGKTKTKVFGVGADQVTNQELGEIFKRLNPSASVTVQPTPPGAYVGDKIDFSRIKEELGFVPKYSLEQVLKMMIDAFKKMKALEDKVSAP